MLIFRVSDVIEVDFYWGKKPNELIIQSNGDVSDEYHSMSELYDHRMLLFTILCNTMAVISLLNNSVISGSFPKIWKSKLHSDGTMFGPEWFIMGINEEKGKQITYHLKIDPYWELAREVDTYERAPEFDGHTSADVLERLKNL